MISSWKTTTAGILSGIVATVGPLTAYLATQMSPTATKVCGGLTCAGIIARVWVGILQTDSPVTVVTTTTPTSVTTVKEGTS